MMSFGGKFLNKHRRNSEKPGKKRREILPKAMLFQRKPKEIEESIERQSTLENFCKYPLTIVFRRDIVET